VVRRRRAQNVPFRLARISINITVTTRCQWLSATPLTGTLGDTASGVDGCRRHSAGGTVHRPVTSFRWAPPESLQTAGDNDCGCAATLTVLPASLSFSYNRRADRSAGADVQISGRAAPLHSRNHSSSATCCRSSPPAGARGPLSRSGQSRSGSRRLAITNRRDRHQFAVLHHRAASVGDLTVTSNSVKSIAITNAAGYARAMFAERWSQSWDDIGPLAAAVWHSNASGRC